jgi:hypothetical protein
MKKVALLLGERNRAHSPAGGDRGRARRGDVVVVVVVEVDADVATT